MPCILLQTVVNSFKGNPVANTSDKSILICRRLIAIILVITFTLTNFTFTPSRSVYAESLLEGAYPRHGIKEVNPREIIDSLSLPEELGSLVESFVPGKKSSVISHQSSEKEKGTGSDSIEPEPVPFSSSRRIDSHLKHAGMTASGDIPGTSVPVSIVDAPKLILYLQDAHTNYDSETNISKIIREIQKLLVGAGFKPAPTLHLPFHHPHPFRIRVGHGHVFLRVGIERGFGQPAGRQYLLLPQMTARHTTQGGFFYRVERRPERHGLLSANEIIGAVLMPRCRL